jgi:hypothetical protein
MALGTAEAATPTATPPAAGVLVDAAHAPARMVAPSPTRTVTRRPSSATAAGRPSSATAAGRPASPTAARRAAQQPPPTTTATPTRPPATVEPTATPTRPPATETARPSAVATQPHANVAPATATATPAPATTTQPAATATQPTATASQPTATRPAAAASPPAATATRTAAPTARPPAAPTSTPAELPSLPRTHQAVRGWQEGPLLVLDVPIRSQLDGSEYQGANCGPASLAMVLEGFDVEARTPLLRNYANLLQGTYGRDDGIALDHLAAIAREAGLRPVGLRDAWSVDAVRAHVRQGHPVIALAKMRLLPDHVGSHSETDHYVVVVGLDGDDLLINDPALPAEKGFRRRVTGEQLEAAWTASSIPRHAVAVAAADGVAELSFGAPAAPPTAATPPVSRHAATPASPLPPGEHERSEGGEGVLRVGRTTPSVSMPAHAPAQPAEAQPALSIPVPGYPQPIVIVITPAPPPVIVLNVPAMPQAYTIAIPSPTPIPDRWARPGRLYPGDATPIPDVAMPRQEAVVLGEALPAAPDSPLRWLLRFALVAGAGSLFRRLVR